MTRNRKKKIKRNIILFIFSAIIIAGISYYAVLNLDFFNIKKIYVEGIKYTDEDRIIGSLGFSKGDNILEAKKVDLETVLKNEPFIKYMKVKIKFPNKVYVDVTEYEDFGVLDDERKITITEKLKVLSIEDYIYNENLVKIKNLRYDVAELGENIKVKGIENNKDKLIELFSYIQNSKTKKEIEYMEMGNLKNITLLLKSGEKIYLGSIEYGDYNYKFFEEIFGDLRKKKKEFISIDFTKGKRAVVKEKIGD